MKKYPRSLPLLVGVMVILADAYLLGQTVDPIEIAPSVPPWMTEQCVVEGLDGQQIIDGTVKPSGVIELRKNTIKNVRLRDFDHESIRVAFDLDRDGRKYGVEGRVWWRE